MLLKISPQLKTQPQLFSCEYRKFLRKAFCMEHLQWLLLKMVEVFLRNSNLTLEGFICTEEFISFKVTCVVDIKLFFYGLILL